MKPALLSLKIASFLYIGLALAMAVVGLTQEEGTPLLAFSALSIVLALLMLAIRRGLRAGKYWAWVTGIIVSGMQVLSVFFPLGIMGLVGLLNAKTRRAFNTPA